MNIAELLQMSGVPTGALIKALEAKALILQNGDELYAARYDRGAHLHDPSSGWWVWKLGTYDAEYFVPYDLSRCTCKAYEEARSACKHIKMLKFGSKGTERIPWKSTKGSRGPR